MFSEVVNDVCHPVADIAGFGIDANNEHGSFELSVPLVGVASSNAELEINVATVNYAWEFFHMVFAGEVESEVDAYFVDFDIDTLELVSGCAAETLELAFADGFGFCLEVLNAYVGEIVFELDSGLHLKFIEHFDCPLFFLRMPNFEIAQKVGS